MNRPEEALQKSFVDLLHLTKPECLWFAVPNEGNRGGKRGALDGARRQAMGIRAGVPDMQFLMPGGKVGFIEFKSEKGRMTQAQDTFRATAMWYGAEYETCKTTDAAIDAMTSWGIKFKRRAS